MNRLTADLLLIMSALIWGIAFVFQKTAMEHLGPLLFVALRSIVAALALAPLAIREARAKATGLPAGLARIALIGGVLFFLGAAFQQFGLRTATVTNTGFLTGLYVVITPLLVWLVQRRRPELLVWLAIALAFAGTWLLGGGTLSGFSTGDRLVAVCAVFWSAHLVATARSAEFDRPMTFSTLQFIVVALIALPLALATETVSLEAALAAADSILFVGLLSSALTFTLLAVAMRHTPPAEAAILVSTETVFAALAGALLLGERLAPIGWAGALMMLMASLLVQLRAVRAGPAPPADLSR
jgi:drug/metabolite transporter (DMT)-like permease